MFELVFIALTTLLIGGLVAANLRPVEMPSAGRGQPGAHRLQHGLAEPR